ncbi:hypothetical protein FHETE_9681 [Fusarium heterosporum]|uniref:Uncharacterized protein n=1 Tax=Fusarium heterosporum TaxID=42747 RepID=A0A8H5SXK7_FUSHE|nr:hypothetical protein FHETE_9681 [Fusarium heterosporum]
MPEHNGYDDDDYYSSGCCMGCCRAGDFSTHDSCGPCYCRRSFKPDYDASVYTGWSFGQYYPGDAEYAGSFTMIDKKSKTPEKTSVKQSASHDTAKERASATTEKTKGIDKPKADKPSKATEK